MSGIVKNIVWGSQRRLRMIVAVMGFAFIQTAWATKEVVVEITGEENEVELIGEEPASTEGKDETENDIAIFAAMALSENVKEEEEDERRLDCCP